MRLKQIGDHACQFERWPNRRVPQHWLRMVTRVKILDGLELSYCPQQHGRD